MVKKIAFMAVAISSAGLTAAAQQFCKTSSDCASGEVCTVVKTGCPGEESHSTCASRQCVKHRPVVFPASAPSQPKLARTDANAHQP